MVMGEAGFPVLSCGLEDIAPSSHSHAVSAGTVPQLCSGTLCCGSGWVWTRRHVAGALWGVEMLLWEDVSQKLDECFSLTDHMKLSGLLSLLGTIQSIILGQALAEGKLKAGKSSSLPPAARTVEHGAKASVRGWTSYWATAPHRTTESQNGTSSNLCRRMTRL